MDPRHSRTAPVSAGARAIKFSVRCSLKNQAILKNFSPFQNSSFLNIPHIANSIFRMMATTACIGFFPALMSFW